MISSKIKSRLTTTVTAVLLFYLLCGVFYVFKGDVQGRAYKDEVLFHLPAIEQFSQNFDFSNYRSATTPGYHLSLSRIGNDGLMRFASSLYTAAFIALLAWLASNKLSIGSTQFLLLPVMASVYILPGAIWLLPDASSWLFIILALMLFYRFSRYLIEDNVGDPPLLWLLLLSLLLALAIWFRQTSVWLTAVLGVLVLQVLRNGSLPLALRLKVSAALSLTALPALLSLLYFYLLWQGLSPPDFQKTHGSFSPAAPAFFLSVLAFYSLFYLPLFYRALPLKKLSKYLLVAAAAGLVIGIFPETSYDKAAGRFSGLWNLARLLPSISEHSVFIMLGSAAGGACLLLWLYLTPAAFRYPLLGGILLFVMTLVLNRFAYERYFAPFLYLLFVLVLSVTDKLKREEIKPLLLAGCLLFSVFNIVVLFTRFG